MQSVLIIIPRVSYEIIAHFIPGVITFVVGYSTIVDTWQLYHFSYLFQFGQNWITILSFIIICYIIGRGLYVIADWTVKPVIKKSCGDPDNYLPFYNKSILRNYVEDYSDTFKKALQSRMTKIFNEQLSDLSEMPYFKLCVQWIECKAPDQAILLKHYHTIEIFARDMATSSLIFIFLLIFISNKLGVLFALISFVVFTYYYYTFQVKRAQSIYNTFFVLTGS